MKCLPMYRGRGEQKETVHAHHLDVWKVLPVVLEATADEEGPEEGPEKGPSKDSLESSESSNMSLYCGRQLLEESG